MNSPRAYQAVALAGFRRYRMFCLLWERQAGKSTLLAEMALTDMMRHPGRTCIYASASLLLGRELILKESAAADASVRDLMKKESEMLFAAAARGAAQAQAANLLFQTADSSSGKILPHITPAEFLELFEAQRLEFRVYHEHNAYSRTQIIAPNVATARGWSGTVFLDEIGFIRTFLELWIAIEPIVSTNPGFKLIMSTTPPQDDRHYCFELLAPPAGLEFLASPTGNWYESDAGIHVHRADAYDTAAAGKKIFDLRHSGEISVEESFQRAISKQGWRVNHALQWILGGAAACDLLRLKSAQTRGENTCRCFELRSDGEFNSALAWLAKHLSPTHPVGLGFDVATTTRQSSNPSVVSVLEQDGAEIIYRAAFVWKIKEPDVVREKIRCILRVIGNRPGGRARALAVDATNEKYFAEDLRRRLRTEVPVLLVVSSERVDKPGLEKPTNWKEYLGDQYIGFLEDNHLTLPPEAYLRNDHRLVLKDRGRFVCEPDAEGCHADTFDSGKLGLHALLGITGTFAYAPTAAPQHNHHRLGRQKGLLI
ncbi:MAG: hypothetical protein JWR69_1033 [Pedosphaera sp.]|nr:hypothetical protein [Pedosphaera sp.]